MHVDIGPGDDILFGGTAPFIGGTWGRVFGIGTIRQIDRPFYLIDSNDFILCGDSHLDRNAYDGASLTYHIRQRDVLRPIACDKTRWHAIIRQTAKERFYEWIRGSRPNGT